MTRSWWQDRVIYQIYPRSFQDANSDGIGDLRGIIERLDYCADLGVDAVWLSPIFPSPMADFGYDISNYTEVDPTFGTLADFDELMAQVKRRDMKLLLDYVPNHTSDRHPWFGESRSARTGGKSEWYLWRDGAADGGPPNNWLSNFGGSAWQWDGTRSQYYYHAFLPEQPDLNWRNPQVVSAMHEVLRFWLRRGVDGFRIDVLWLLIKDDQYRDNPPNPAYDHEQPVFQSQIPLYTSNRPEVQSVVAGLRGVADEFGDKVLIGEVYLPLEQLMGYYGANLDGVQLPFNFQLLHSTWDARSIAKLIDRYEGLLPRGAWPNWVLGNHDNPRIASRLGLSQVRIAAVLLLTLRGTPTLYYGDEVGMSNVDIPSSFIRDPLEKNVPGKGLGRDACRTPMQWDDTRYAGFSSHDPWLPVSPDYATVNVRKEQEDSSSVLMLYRRLLELRRSHPALTAGDYEAVEARGSILAYMRHSPGHRLFIVLNFGAEPCAVSLPSIAVSGRVLLSTQLDRAEERCVGQVELRVHEGIIVALASKKGSWRHDQ